MFGGAAVRAEQSQPYGDTDETAPSLKSRSATITRVPPPST